ncbi:hypothetical protein HN935_02280 [archaeon]|jgi:SAM-dependent methyltransferase|nr:hypothetical protein [archaeon]
MEIIKWKDIIEDDNLSGELYKRVRSPKFVDKIIREYGAFPEGEYSSDLRLWLASKFYAQINPAYQVLNGNVSQKRILDLGCGSSSGTYESEKFDPKMYEPWFCRVFKELGANPVGIDIGNLNEEKFEHYTANLLLPDSLDFLENNSIDVVTADLLYNSPTLEQMRGFGDLRELLLPQLERIVKPDGFFVEGSW